MKIYRVIILARCYDLSSLKVLGSVGETINPEVWEWYNAHIGYGKCPIVDTWWQTETGGFMISPVPGLEKRKLMLYQRLDQVKLCVGF